MNKEVTVSPAYLKKKKGQDLHSVILGLVLAALVLSAGGIYFFAKKLWISLRNTIQTPTPLWATSILVFVVLVYTHLKIHKSSQQPSDIEFYKDFGVLWDNNLIPHCPSCKTMLSNYANYHIGNNVFRPGLKCISCDSILYFFDESHFHISLEEAKKQVRLRINQW